MWWIIWCEVLRWRVRVWACSTTQVYYVLHGIGIGSATCPSWKLVPCYNQWDARKRTDKCWKKYILPRRKSRNARRPRSKIYSGELYLWRWYKNKHHFNKWSLSGTGNWSNARGQGPHNCQEWDAQVLTWKFRLNSRNGFLNGKRLVNSNAFFWNFSVNFWK